MAGKSTAKRSRFTRIVFSGICELVRGGAITEVRVYSSIEQAIASGISRKLAQSLFEAPATAS